MSFGPEELSLVEIVSLWHLESESWSWLILTRVDLDRYVSSKLLWSRYQLHIYVNLNTIKERGIIDDY